MSDTKEKVFWKGKELYAEEVKVLAALVEEYDSWGEGGFFHFDELCRATGLGPHEVPAYCRSLRAKGLAVFARGLRTDDGAMAGSGYAATEEGAKLLNPCDHCGELASYDWQEDSGGKSPWHHGFDKETATRHRECDDCHEKKKLTTPNAY